MFSALRTRYGIPGVIATAALVFAMTGGAFAAKYLITSTKQIKPSVLKKLKGAVGPAGAAGAQGPQGPAGAAGAAGAAGKDGAQGAQGEKGATGTNGTSATTTAFSGAKGACTEGGIEVKSASPAAFVCNGLKGADGKDGETGFTSTLPPGETETGAWATTVGSFETAFVGISFSIPLAKGLDEDHVHFVEPGKTAGTGCTGGTAAAPKADPGHLCVYVATFLAEEGKSVAIRTLEIGSIGASEAGAFFQVEGPPGEIATGSYAVTAPLTP